MTPSGLASRPDIEADDTQYLDCFRILDRGRAGGISSPLPISIQDVYTYLLMVGENRPNERLKTLKFVQDMDEVFLNRWAESQKRENG